MKELDYKESLALKNWCFWTVVLEMTLESSLDSKEIKPVNPKGKQSWIIGRTDAEAEAPILWPPDMKNWLIGKDPDAGKEWRQEEKGVNRGWNRWMASPTLWTWVWASSGNWYGQGSLVCCSPWGHWVRHNWATELNWTLFVKHRCSVQFSSVAQPCLTLWDPMNRSTPGLPVHHRQMLLFPKWVRAWMAITDDD